MNKEGSHRKIVFATPWFQVQESPSNEKFPNYSIQSPDFVCIVALTKKGDLLLVRQFRHAIEKTTLELPAGHVEKDETPEEAARKELLEETGHVAETFELLASLPYSPSRYTNRIWCYFAANSLPAPEAKIEAGINCVLHNGGLKTLLKNPDFCSMGNWAVLMAAVAKGKLNI